jgi:hypothetical protein
MIGIIENLYTPLRTTSNYSATVNLHNSQITTAPAKPFLAYVLTSRSLAIASNSGNSSAPRAQNLSRTELSTNPTVCLKHRHASVTAGTCLPNRCPETALVYQPISRSLHTKGSTRCNIKDLKKV